MTDYQEWIKILTQQIFQKYNISNPIFTYDDFFKNEQEREVYLRDALTWPMWLKYCHLKDNIFELKPFTPDPSPKICEKIVDNFFKEFYKSVFHPKEKITFTLFADCTYNQKEMHKELLYLVRTGHSKIEVVDGPFQDDEDVIYLLAVKQDSLENMLKMGYILLEYENE